MRLFDWRRFKREYPILSMVITIFGCFFGFIGTEIGFILFPFFRWVVLLICLIGLITWINHLWREGYILPDFNRKKED